MSAAREDAAVEPAALYRRERRLRGRLTVPPDLVEDACASAWLILVAKQPVCGERIFGWLCTTALHEAYRLLRAERREQPSELSYDQRPAFVPPGRDDPEAALEARRALWALGSLRELQRRYIAWQVGGYRYREVQELAGGATYTNVISGRLRQRRRGWWPRVSTTCRRRSPALSLIGAIFRRVPWRHWRALGLRSHAFGRSRG